uniref:Zinc finger protein 507 n=1 Tax=Tetraodon nigroviridis TaxID=99883 RepID=H3CDC4_TETNG
MEEISNVAVLITHSSAASSSSALGPLAQTQVAVEEEASQSLQQKHTADSLIQVIEKLSKIVEKRPQHQFTLAGQKRAILLASSEEEEREVHQTKGATRGSPSKKVPSLPTTEEAKTPQILNQKRTVTCYQCSLCPYLSQTLPLLKEHLKQHNEQHTDLILMCSKCHFTSRDQGQLEAHVKEHLASSDEKESNLSDCEDMDVVSKTQEGSCTESSSLVASKELPQKKKWYSYEEYGLYRCLICSYVCSQQRMLKTHAWKHAGQVDCSYPIFEDEEGAQAGKEVHPAAHAPGGKEKRLILSPVVRDKSPPTLPSAVRLQLPETPPDADKKEDLGTRPVSLLREEALAEDERVYDFKEEAMVEVQVKTEVESEGAPISSAITHDSLLSSAQKIISSNPNSAGHINVIVERLPSAEDSVLSTNPLFLGPDEERDKSSLYAEEEACGCIQAAEDEVDSGGSAESAVGTATKSAAKNSDPSRDENVPPAGRKRTHSESLRLHSLAAEALVTMPMRTLQVAPLGTKANAKSSAAQAHNRSPEEKQEEVATSGQGASGGALSQLELQNEKRETGVGSLGLAEADEEEPVTKAGISLSLLAVIERLRERSDQNASDEDILKELRDNAQFHNNGLAASSDGGLVDYIPGCERPYRCRLCRYSSSNKGYIKQHLRVHRQRQPYQCPICEHIALDSKDLESHMIHHCKTRTYQCKVCQETFHHKSQLRNHEKEHENLTSDTTAFNAIEGIATAEDAEREIGDCTLQKLFKCDVCDYTSSTYVGVRNHRRIHNSEKPYRCSLCGYVCSHPPSLKSHMWKHAGDQNYNYEQVNKAINEAISQSSSRIFLMPLETLQSAPQPSKDRAKGSAEAAAASVGPSVDGSGGVLSGVADPSEHPTLTQSQSQAPLPGPGMEYCVLLFCCCICGFESTSKEHLMEHMKDHEGDIISIILNKCHFTANRMS